MNGYHLAIVTLVACLAAGANAGTTTSDLEAADFVGLNKYLTSKLSDETSEANFELMEREVANLEGGVKRAAQIYLALRDVKECNEDVRSMFAEIKSSALYHPDLHGQSLRYITILRPHIKNAIEICAQYIEQTVDDKYVQLSSDAKVAKLVDVVNGGVNSSAFRVFSKAGATEQAAYLEQLAGGDIELIAGSRANFYRLFDEHIGEPCQKIVSGLEGTYQEAKIVANVYLNWLIFAQDRSNSFKRVIWAYSACKDLLSLDKTRKTMIFHHF